MRRAYTAIVLHPSHQERPPTGEDRVPRAKATIATLHEGIIVLDVCIHFVGALDVSAIRLLAATRRPCRVVNDAEAHHLTSWPEERR